MNKKIKSKDRNIVKIAFDESGNTGQNLIDPVQRYYVLASINLSDEEVESSYELMRGNANELHFVKMKKYNNSRKSIIEFLNLDLITDSKVKFSFSDKKFTIIGHLIDLLISRGALKQQIDVFRNGLDFILQNAFLKSCIIHDDQKLLMKVLNMFVLIIREKNISLKDDFYNLVKQFKSLKSDGNDKVIFDFLLNSESEFEKIINSTNKYTLDPTLSTFLVLADLWSKEINQEYEVIHDKSKQMEHWSPRIKFLSENMISTDEWDTCNFKFPLNQNNFTIRDSVDYKRIQLADIIASSISFKLNQNQSKNDYIHFANSIGESKLFSLNFHSIKPVPNPIVKINEIEDEEVRKNFKELLEIFGKKNKSV